MMCAVDDVVELLKDGKWHTIEELASNLQVRQQKLQQIVRFLESLDLVKLDSKQQKAAITSDLKKLMTLEH